MSLRRRSPLAGHLLCLLPLAAAQNVATLTGSPTQSMTTAPSGFDYGSIFATASAMPSASDSAPGGGSSSNNNDGFNNGGLVNYYFVFIALILFAAALSLFLLLRRRKRRMARYRTAPIRRPSQLQPYGVDFNELQQNRSGWDNWSPERRRYWPRFSREAEVAREEGLDEHGQAPPPYRPKTSGGDGDGDGVTVPPPIVTRDDTGFKPPDYSETQTGGSSQR